MTTTGPYTGGGHALTSLRTNGCRPEFHWHKRRDGPEFRWPKERDGPALRARPRDGW